MSYTNFIRCLRMVVVLIIQIIILNHIHIIGYITPLILGYMIIPFNKNAGRIELLIWGFLTGLIFDIFSNTAGMGAGSCTLLAMVQPAILNLFRPRDAAEDFSPSIKVMGFWKYTLYILLCTFVIHAVFYALDAFTLANWQLTLLAIAVGTLIITILCLIAGFIVKPKN